ncbi:MAG: hypothetical protein GY898_23000 [Proteobacteria bacterium]|nr:hypothetical protein [Pseudomonadota bacterium]
MGVVNEAAELGWKMQAQERLMAVADMQAGNGLMKKRSQRAHIRGLKRQALGPRRRTSEPGLTRSDAEAEPQVALEAQAFGIQVVEVPPDTQTELAGQAELEDQAAHG